MLIPFSFFSLALPIVPSDYILDVLNLAERMAAAVGMATIKRKDNSTVSNFHVECRKKLWIDVKGDLSNDMLAVMIYHQLLEVYNNGKILSSKEIQPEFVKTIVDLAALQMKALGSVDQNLLKE